jgi:phosphoribosylformimino-5-aminoimidazole carboxamide ribotide isomerase
MFDIIPAVDIQGGKAVRLYEGDPERETVYFEHPLDAARHWAKLGATWLHIVDLDAALGRGNNAELVREIAASVEVKIELGGGIRSAETAHQWLTEIDRVVLGTVAVTQPEVLDALLADYDPTRIAVSVDAREGQVAVRGWAKVTEMTAQELAELVAAQGVRHVIYTDIARDGTMKGVDAKSVRHMRQAFPHTLVAGGGVASDKDLELYAQLGLDGAVVGRALYEGKITYPRAP